MVVFSVEAQASQVGSGATVAAALTTHGAPDIIGVFVAWTGNVRVATLDDTASTNWIQKGNTFTINKVSGVALTAPISVLYFWALASTNLTTDTITATFTGAGATRSLISTYAVTLANTRFPFDANAVLGLPSVQGVTNAAGFSVPLSTWQNHFIAIAFTVLFPRPGGETNGAGWTPQNSGTATDFGWILESKLFTTIQSGAPVLFVSTAGSYTALTIIDAIEAPDSTHYPVTETLTSEASTNVPLNAGFEIKQSFAENLPITSATNAITHDFSDSDPSGFLAHETHKAKKNSLISGPESNEYDGEQSFTDETPAPPPS
jgi:hypothetical protein